MIKAALCLCVLGGVAWAETSKAIGPRAITLPDGEGGIGFDDLRFDRERNLVLVPAGRTGRVDLIDPASSTVTPIAGFSKVARYDAGHGQSVTSVDVGDGFLFATDRTALELVIVDLKTKTVVGRTRLASAPDYVRWVASRREVWVTEPGKKRIEVFALSNARPPVATHAAFIETPGGPESLVIDERRKRAYTHKWKEATMAIDLATRAIVATWRAGCGDPRGIALDEEHGFLLLGCEDGTATALDVEHEGRLLGTVKSGSGVDIIAWDPKRRHLYVPGDESATMAIVGVSPAGALSVVRVVPTVKDAHCVTTDEQGSAYVCDPRRGQLLVVPDP